MFKTIIKTICTAFLIFVGTIAVLVILASYQAGKTTTQLDCEIGEVMTVENCSD